MNLSSIPNLTERVSMRSVDLVHGDPSRWVQDTRSGLIIPHDHVPAPRPLCVDLFCGCGGFSLGVIQAGFDVVAACDNDEWATLTYLCNLGTYPIDLQFLGDGDKERLNKAVETQIDIDNGTVDPDTLRRRKPNRKGEPPKPIRSMPLSGQHRPADRPGVPHFFFGDVRKLTGKMVLDAAGVQRGDIDLVVGGPPCQGFSQAGKRDVMDPRNSLVFEFARLIIEISPKFFCMENVPGIRSMTTPGGLNVLDAFCRVLADGKYGSYEALCAAMDMEASKESGAKFAARARRTADGAGGTADAEDGDDEISLPAQMAMF